MRIFCPSPAVAANELFQKDFSPVTVLVMVFRRHRR